MFDEFGGLFGWLLVLAVVGTILNYFVKVVNKKWGKKISSNDSGKKVMKLLMKIFVRNHKYFGLLTAVLLTAHFAIQFAQYGINLTGSLAAAFIILQVALGIYANHTHKPRKGVWFVAHRIVAVLIVLAIVLHLLVPYALNNAVTKDSPTDTQSEDTSNLKIFTKDELAQYNGENGNDAYVAYKDVVYDVTNHSKWKNGQHNGKKAGTDLTKAISSSPHGDKVFEDLPVVGKYTD